MGRGLRPAGGLLNACRRDPRARDFFFKIQTGRIHFFPAGRPRGEGRRALGLKLLPRSDVSSLNRFFPDFSELHLQFRLGEASEEEEKRDAKRFGLELRSRSDFSSLNWFSPSHFQELHLQFRL